jgi:hypothetical protein
VSITGLTVAETAVPDTEMAREATSRVRARASDLI